MIAGSEVVKRLETSPGVPDPTGAADEHPNIFAIVGTRYATVCVGTHRLRHRCKPKAGQQERDKKERTCAFKINPLVHINYLSVLPVVKPAIAVLEGQSLTERNWLLANPAVFSCAEVFKNRDPCQAIRYETSPHVEALKR